MNLMSLNMCFRMYLIKERSLFIRHDFVLLLRMSKAYNVKCVNSELETCFHLMNLSVFETLLICV